MLVIAKPRLLLLENLQQIWHKHPTNQHELALIFGHEQVHMFSFFDAMQTCTQTPSDILQPVSAL